MERTKQQNDAIVSRARRICVDAGAGSGKTRILVERIVDILSRKEAGLEEITAITFMDKAAAEMKDRLRRAFRVKASAPFISSEDMNEWRSMERRVEHARISTIHSFCTSLLRENALRLGLDPDFGLLTGPESALLMDQTITETLHALYEKNDGAALRVATEFRSGPLNEMLKKLLGKRNLLERLNAAYPLNDPEALCNCWEERMAEERTRRLLALRNARVVKGFLRQLRQFEGQCTNAADGREIRRVTAIDALERIGRAENAAAVENQLGRILGDFKNGAKKFWDSEEVYKRLTKLQDSVKAFAQDALKVLQDADGGNRAAQITCDFHQTRFRRYGGIRSGQEADEQPRFR